MLKPRHFVIAFLLLAAALGATLAMAGGRPLSTTLTGVQAVPRLGDRDGSGEITLNLNPGAQQACYQLSVSGIAAATAATIEKAPAGRNGEVIANLIAPNDGFSGTCVRLQRDTIVDILNHPADYYVSVLNKEYPDGALRGQLVR